MKTSGRHTLRILGLSLFTLMLAACQGANDLAQDLSSSESDLSQDPITPEDPVVEDPLDPEDPGNPDPLEPTPPMKICSKLSFDGLDWPTSLIAKHREPFALTLNVSGSFEGHSGWQNLADNFDGQGISMGLLNQNFGQGSLQPIWIEMFKKYKSQVSAEFTTSQVNSIKSMLDKWASYSSSSRLRISDYGYNELDDPEMVARDLGVPVEEILVVTSSLLQKNQESVNWTKSNILTGTKIKSDWKPRLKAFSASQGYRSLQVEKALALHNQTMNYMKAYNMTELRAYLLFFDFVVQNGGLPSSVKSKYDTWLRSNPSSTEYSRLKKIIDLRVVLANPRWQADVRTRKMSILDGTGTVHGAKRDYNKEYCTNIRAKFP